MDGYLVKGSIGIPRGSLLRIDEGAGMLLYVWEGEVWVTQEGSAKDHVLRAGQWFRVDRGGAALAHAFRRSVVGLSAPTTEIPARSIALHHPRGALPVVLHRADGSSAARSLRKWLGGLFLPRPAATS